MIFDEFIKFTAEGITNRNIQMGFDMSIASEDHAGTSPVPCGHGTSLQDMAAMAHFRAIIESSDDAIISKTLDGIVVSWNQGAQSLFGYTAQEMLGWPLLALFPPDRQHENQFTLEKILAGEQVDHFETVRLHKDGSALTVSVTISPIRDPHGRVIGVSKVARDITAQKLADARLKLISAVFTKTSEGIVITDALGTIVEVNEALSRISGYSREEMLGQKPMMFEADQHRPKPISARSLALIRDGHYQGEVRRRRKDGEACVGFLNINQVRDSTGAVQNYIALFSDTTSLRAKQKELEHLAHFDALTDLPNRKLLSDRLRQAIAVSQRRRQSLAVLYIDLDGFKEINDAHGHGVGDQVLIAVSRHIQGALGAIDTLARIGGDEYVAVLADVNSPEDCVRQVERILRACAEPVILSGKVVPISASIGVALYPQDDADADQLVRHADRAMYEAKQAGKNRYHLFDSDMDAKLKKRRLQYGRLSQALVAGEFILHYQPKVNMRTGVVFGVEALIRWNHPEHGELAPDTFLPAIENHPLSEAVGVWVIDTALAQMARWRSAGLNITMSVNIDVRQLQQKSFACSLSTLLAKYPSINPNDLELEILESSSLHSLHDVSAIMHDCQHMGVRFALDDFGTGYSSLAYLRHLPAETLKIDRSFVQNMLDNQEDRAIVQGVIGLAAAFTREVIAEGVESEAIGRKLLDLGCELAQGYGIARPMPGEQLLQWMARWRAYPSWS